MYYELITYSLWGMTAFSCFISLPMYILILRLIIKNRKVEPFNSDFFTIFFALGVAEIGIYIMNVTGKFIFLGFVPEIFKPFNKGHFILSIYRYFYLLPGICQYQLIFLITLNRFVSIVFPMFYNVYWTKKVTYVFIGVFFVFTFFASSPENRLFHVEWRNCYPKQSVVRITHKYPSPVLISNTQILQYTVEVDGKNRTFQFGPFPGIGDRAGAYLLQMWSLHVYGLLISTTVFYIIMYIKLRRSSNGFGDYRSIERQMFMLGFMIFILNLVYTLYFSVRPMVFPEDAASPLKEHYLYLIIGDFYDLPNGYFLYFTSPRVRKLVGETFNKVWKRGADTEVTMMSSNGPSNTNTNTLI